MADPGVVTGDRASLHRIFLWVSNVEGRVVVKDEYEGKLEPREKTDSGLGTLNRTFGSF